jgi:outer membrane protein assembly factor BamB
MKGIPMTRHFGWLLVAFSLALIPLTGSASDWTHWRGPSQTGVSPDKNLPDKIADNVIWRAPFGSRSTPLVMGDRVYIINYTAEKTKVGDRIEDVQETIQERVMCLDAKSGKKLWQHTFPVFHTDIVTSRLGWTNLAADPSTGYIYAHGTQGLFICLDGKDGKVVWQHSMGEEYGRVSGYGGRITSPIVDEDLAILGMVNSSWGDQAKGGNRYVAFNKRTGSVVWWSEPAASKGTYYSNPVIATIKGQRLLISGAADGSVFGIKVRTGEPVWSYKNFSVSPINSTPVVDGNLVYIGHGEESPGNNIQGRVICLDASQIENGAPKLVWETNGIHARYASPIINEGRLYMPDDGGRLYCLDAKSGKEIWKFNYGRGETRGSPVFADGKIYVGEVNARFHILEPGAKKCKRLDQEFFPGAGGVDVEINGTPAVANGRVYFSTAEETICIGLKDGVSSPNPTPEKVSVTPGKITHLQILPAEIALHSGGSANFKALAFDANGNFVKEVKAEWSLPAPTPPKGVKANPPALKGAITSDGKLTVDAKLPNQQSIVVGTFEGVSGKARVRVVPQIPYANSFENLPDGIVPGGWVNTQGKFLIKTVAGNKVLAKVNDKFSPLISRGNAYMTLPTAKDYTLQCDVQGTKVGTNMPEIGIVANRYTLLLVGNVQKLRLQSWDALPRVDKTIDFNFQPGVWYTMKLTTAIQGDKGVVRGKVWPKEEKEPVAWSIEVTDSRPITEGSAALYGYVTGNFNDQPGTEIYYDNVRITPNKGAEEKKVGASQPIPAANPPLVSVETYTYPHVQSRRGIFPLFQRLRR